MISRNLNGFLIHLIVLVRAVDVTADGDYQGKNSHTERA